MKKYLITAMLLSGLSATMTAQHVRVTNKIVDVGQVVYRQPVTAVFNVTNTEGRNLHIDRVDSSCGCATADIQSRTIPAHGKTDIKVTYDAKLMGHFEKQVYLWCEKATEPVELTIKGIVVEQVSEYQGTYHHQLGTLLTDIRDIDFGDVVKGEMPYIDIHVKNPTDKPLSPVVMHQPGYLMAETSPTTIPPGKTGVVRMILASQQAPDYGQIQAKVYLGDHPGDKANNSKSIPVSALILPNVQHASEADLAKAPKLELSDTEIDFSSVDGKVKKTVTVILANKGISSLQIYEMQIHGDGIKVSLPTMSLKTGEHTKLKITADTKQLSHTKTQPLVQLITNDPQHTKVILPIKGAF